MRRFVSTATTFMGVMALLAGVAACGSSSSTSSPPASSGSSSAKSSSAPAASAPAASSSSTSSSGQTSAPASSAPAASSSASAKASASSSFSNPYGLKFNSDGTPNLKGVTFKLSLGGPGPQVPDSTIYIQSQILKQWGATVKYTVATGSSTHLGTARGIFDMNDTNIATGLNAGLDMVGPAMAHVDYLLVSKDFSTLAQMKGKKIAISNQQAPDDLLELAALKKAGLSLSDINVSYTNTTAAGLAAVVSGRLDAAWIHSSQWLTLQSQGKAAAFHIVAKAADVAPWDADSFWFANPKWAKSNPAMVEAADLAWLHAAKIFQTNKSQWVNYAQQYTSSANSATETASIYDSLKLINGWPDTQSAYTSSVVQQNLAAVKKLNDLKGAGLRPMSQWAIFGPWNAAWAAFQAGH